MTDMLVNLYAQPPMDHHCALTEHGIAIKQALTVDKAEICNFVATQFGDSAPGWAGECEVSLSRLPTSCFVAVHADRLIGFCCYDAVARGMLGPIGVSSQYRDRGVARALLQQCLEAMKAAGYAYAVIGWVSSEAFFNKTCGAIAIPDSFPGIYSRLIAQSGEL